MREYRNKKTGVVIFVKSEIIGDDWDEVKPEPVKKSAKKKKKEQ